MAAAEPPEHDRRIHDALIEALEPIQSPGKFAVTGVLPATLKPNDPGFALKGIGKITLPLSSGGVRALAETARRTSPDTQEISFRNTWEIDPEHFSFVNGGLWTTVLDDVVNDIHKQFGLEDGLQIASEPFKLFVQEPGAQLNLQTSPTVLEDHLATLFICLPTQFSGGSVEVSLAGESMTIDKQNQSSTCFQYLVWLKDTVRTFQPITSGARVILGYMLCAISQFAQKCFRTLQSPEQDRNLGLIFQTWKAEDDGCAEPHILAYKLQHPYQADNIYKQLLGADYARVQALRSACEQEGSMILFGQLKKEIRFNIALEHHVAMRHQSMNTLPQVDCNNVSQIVQEVSGLQDVVGKTQLESTVIYTHEIAQVDAFSPEPGLAVMYMKADGNPNGTGIKSEYDLKASNWCVIHQYCAPIVLLIPSCNLPAWNFRSWMGGRSVTLEQEADHYFSKQILAAKVKGWSATYTADPNVLRICDIVLAHEELRCEEILRTVVHLPQVQFYILEQVAMIALEYNHDRIFRRACTRLRRSLDHDIGFRAVVHKLPQALVFRLFETADFEQINFWLSLHGTTIARLKALNEIVETFSRGMLMLGVAKGIISIQDWQTIQLRRIFATMDPNTDMRAEELTELLRMGSSFKGLDLRTEAQQLLVSQSHDLRKPSFLWKIVRSLSQTTHRVPKDHMNRFVEALVSAVQENGGIESSDTPSAIHFEGMSTDINPETLVLLVPVLKLLMNNVLNITEFLKQADSCPVWKTPEFCTAFHVDIVEPVIAKLSVTTNNMEHKGGTPIADVKLFAELLSDLGLNECIQVLSARLRNLDELSVDDIRSILPEGRQQELQSEPDPDLVVDLTASSRPDFKRES